MYPCPAGKEKPIISSASGNGGAAVSLVLCLVSVCSTCGWVKFLPLCESLYCSDIRSASPLGRALLSLHLREAFSPSRSWQARLFATCFCRRDELSASTPAITRSYFYILQATHSMRLNNGVQLGGVRVVYNRQKVSDRKDLWRLFHLPRISPWYAILAAATATIAGCHTTFLRPTSDVCSHLTCAALGFALQRSHLFFFWGLSVDELHISPKNKYFDIKWNLNPRMDNPVA